VQCAEIVIEVVQSDDEVWAVVAGDRVDYLVQADLTRQPE
jgi:hypothetical protein